MEDEKVKMTTYFMKLFCYQHISERIEESGVCPNTMLQCVAYKGPQNDVNNIKACLKKLNEYGENVPRFG